jgi:hypothetical protein
VCLGTEKQSRWWTLVGVCGFITLLLVVWRWFRGLDTEDGVGTMSNHSSRRSSITDRLAALTPSPVGGMRAY